MRELTKTDLLMLDNTIRMLKQVNFRNLEFDEMLGANQSWIWVNRLRQELASSIRAQEQQKGLDNAIASAKEVTPQAVAQPEVKSSEASSG